MSDATVGAIHAEASLGTASWEKSLTRIERTTRLAMGQTGRSFQGVQRELSLTERHVNNLEKSLAGAARTLAGPFAAALSVQTLQRFGSEALKAADNIEKMSRQTALSTETFQAWSVAAQNAGVQANSFESSMTRFTRRVGEARKEMGPLNSALKETNKELLENIKNSRDQEEALGYVAEAIAEAEDQTERLRLANAAFGREGLTMVEFLKDGRAGLQRYKAEAQAMGHVLSREATSGVEDFNTAMDNLGRTIKTQVQEGFLKEFNKDTERLTGLAKDKDFQEGLQLIGAAIAVIANEAERAVRFVGGLSTALKDLSPGGLVELMARTPGARALQWGWEQGSNVAQWGRGQLGLPNTQGDMVAERIRSLSEQIVEAQEKMAQAIERGASAWQIERRQEYIESLERERLQYMAMLDPVGGVADGLENLNTVTLQSIIVTGEAAEETDHLTTTLNTGAAAVNRFALTFEQLRDQLDPVGAAQRSYAKDVETLDKALATGLIPTLEEYDKLMDALNQRYADQLDPYQAVIDALDQELELLRMSDEQREIHLKMLDIENELRRMGIELTEEQSRAIAGRIRAIQEETKALREQEAQMRRIAAEANRMSASFDSALGSFADRAWGMITDPSSWNKEGLRNLFGSLAQDLITEAVQPIYGDEMYLDDDELADLRSELELAMA